MIPDKSKTPPAATGGFLFRFNRREHNAAKDSFQGFNSKELRHKKYKDALIALPQRGGGLHAALMGVANLGVLAGLTDQQLYDGLKASGRAFRRGEIEETIKEARQGKRCNAIPLSVFKAKANCYEKIAEDKKTIFADYIRSMPGIDPFGPDLWGVSNPRPSALDPLPGIEGSQYRSDMILFLSAVYKASDILYIGNGFERKEQQPEHIKPVDKWISFFEKKLDKIENEADNNVKVYLLQNIAKSYPFLIINPLNGKATSEGSYRSGENIKEFRYILFEIDQDPNTGEKMPLPVQLSIMSSLRLPILSLVYSGSKSIHAIVDLEKFNKGQKITTREEWTEVKEKLKIKNKAFKIGLDEQALTPERLSRLPGIWLSAPDKGILFENMKWQQLLYLNSQGGPFYVGYN